MLRSKIFIMARGDVFKKPLANWALRSMRVLPIFRAEDGAGNEQSIKNQRTYNESLEIFHRNGNVVIFPEGLCITERRLRPLKKGAAKLSFEALEKHHEMDLQILPIGMNYSHPGKFREEVCISIGKPIPVKDFSNLLNEGNPAKAIQQLNERLYEALEKEMVIIKDPANDVIGSHYLQMARNHYKPSFWGFIKTTKKRFLAEKRAANDLNYLSETNPQSFEVFKSKIHDYLDGLDEVKIDDKFLTIPLHERILYFIFTFVFAIPAFFGLIINFPPVLVAKRIADKTVKRIEFYDSVNIGAGTICSLIYFIILCAIFIPIFGLNGLWLVIGLRLLGLIYLYWNETALNTLHWFRILFTSKGRNFNRALQSQRKFILEYFN